MVMEATMICIDNSDYARNEDFTPSRLEAQQDTANLLCGTKTQVNPENAVGLLVMGGPRVQVSVAPTSDMGAFLLNLLPLRCEGESDFIRGLHTAQLALKHRSNRNQRQRIVLFVCSPIKATAKQLETLGKGLRKNNISLDIISFGEVPGNAPLVQKLFQAVNSNQTSHLVEVTDNSMSLPRQIRESAIISADTGERTGEDANAMDEFGVDPNTDPELYMALRLSLEEERARARRAAESSTPAQVRAGHTEPVEGESTVPIVQVQNDEGGPIGALGVSEPSVAEAEANDRPPTIEEIQSMDNIDPDLKQALLLSLQEVAMPPSSSSSPPAQEATAVPPVKRPNEEEMGEPKGDGQNKRRKTEGSGPPSVEFQTPQSEMTDERKTDEANAALVGEVMRGMAGVNLSDPQVQEALKNLPSASSQQPDEKDESDEKKKD